MTQVYPTTVTTDSTNELVAVLIASSYISIHFPFLMVSIGRMSCLGLLHLPMLVVVLTLVLFLPSVTSLAAKKSPQRTRSASTIKGFGAPPLTLDETVATFWTRRPDHPHDSMCPCGTGRIYSNCCQPFHTGSSISSSSSIQSLPSPKQVLQSRYTAFAWRMIPYIMETTHPTCREYQLDRIAWAKDLNKNGMFDSYEFVNLTILNEQNDDEKGQGLLEFKVTLRAKEDKGSMIAGQEMTVIETSTFIKDEVTGKWLYASGEVRPDVKGLEEAVLNP